MRHLRSVIVLSWLACGLSPLAHAGGFTITVFGGRRTGSMTNLASPDDLTAIFHNPAGLADMSGLRLHASSSLTFLDTAFELQALDRARFPEIDSPRCGTTGEAPCRWPVGPEGYYQRSIEAEKTFGVLPFLGLSKSLAPFGIPGLTVGLAVYAPDFYGAFLSEEAPSAYHLIEGTFLVLATTAAAGYRINRYIALGANLSYHFMRISFIRRLSIIDALTPAGATPEPLADAGQSLLGDLRMDYSGIDHGLGWGASVLATPTRWLRLALGYNGATAASFDGEVDFRALGALVRDKPDALAKTLEVLKVKLPSHLVVEMPIPHALTIGAAVIPKPWIEVAIDYRIWFYSVFETQVIKPSYDPNQPGEEPLTEAGLSRAKNYRLSHEIGLGLLFRPLPAHPGLELLTGLSYDRSPIPDETFTLDNPSLSLVQLGVGVRWQATERLRLACSYMLFLYLARDIQNSETSPPTNARGDGTAHLPGIEVELQL